MSKIEIRMKLITITEFNINFPEHKFQCMAKIGVCYSGKLFGKQICTTTEYK